VGVWQDGLSISQYSSRPNEKKHPIKVLFTEQSRISSSSLVSPEPPFYLTNIMTNHDKTTTSLRISKHARSFPTAPPTVRYCAVTGISIVVVVVCKRKGPAILFWDDPPPALAKFPLPLPLPFYIPLTPPPPPPPPPFLAPRLGFLLLDLLLTYYCSTHHRYHHNHRHPTSLAPLPAAFFSSCLGHKVLRLLTPMSTHKLACEALALVITFVLEIALATPVL